jgi:AraC-like DNA-binding protein
MSLSSVAGVVIKRLRRRNDMHSFYSEKKPDYYQNALMMIFKGAIFFNYGKTRFTAPKDSIVCWGPTYPRERRPVQGEPASYVLLALDILSDEGGKLGFPDIGFPPLIRVKSPQRICSLLDDINASLNSAKPQRGPARSILGLKLLQAIDEERIRVSKPETAPAPRLHSRIREALENIQENFKKQHTVAALAKKACMHPTYFAHLFKEEIGVSPHQYILDYKIEKAKEFLCTFDEALDYTAEELGFHDYSHFYRAFKKVTGKTPMQFIRENKGLYDPK